MVMGMRMITMFNLLQNHLDNKVDQKKQKTIQNERGRVASAPSTMNINVDRDDMMFTGGQLDELQREMRVARRRGSLDSDGPPLSICDDQVCVQSER